MFHMHTYQPQEYWDARIHAVNKRIVKNASGMAKSYEEFIKLAQGKAVSYIIDVLMLNYPRLVVRTPVDTGTARKGWQISVNTQSEYTPKYLRQPNIYPETKDDADAREYAINQIQSQLEGLMQTDVIHITNNVRYILGLEAGIYSNQNQAFIARFIKEVKRRLTIGKKKYEQ